LFGDTSLLLGINQIINSFPGDYNLSQNFPNPFNPSTKINFDVKDASHVKLVVYDLLGREVSVLVNEHVKPASYEVNFNGSNLSSGMYFYRLLIDNNLIDTKKMVLLK